MKDHIENIIKDMEKIKITHKHDSLLVEEVIHLPSFKKIEVIAGKNGLKNYCKHITILETPEGLNWMKGGEFLLTAGYALYGEGKSKQDMVLNAYNKGVAAIGIKENRYFGEIDSKLIEDADKYSIPLIKISNDAFYTEVVSSFYDLLFYKKNEHILNLNDKYEKLLNLSFENKDINGILHSLSNILSSNVILFDDNLNFLNSHIIEPRSYKGISLYYPFNREGKIIIKDIVEPYLNYKTNNTYISIYPIMRKTDIVAYLYLVGSNKVSELEDTAIKYGKSIISMKLEREWIIGLRQTSFNKILVETMLNNENLTEEFYNNVEKELGWDKEGRFTGLCIKIYDNPEDVDMSSKIYESLDKILGFNNYLYFEQSNEFFIFLKLESNAHLKDIVEAIKKEVDNKSKNTIVTIGVSNTYTSLRKIKKLYNESYLAALFDKNKIVYYDFLNTIKLLYPLREDDGIKDYYSGTIGKLVEYDIENKASLVETLEFYFRYDFNNKVTASKLFIHVETLRYRLKRIEEITGYSINDSEGRFTLQMGLKLRKIIKIK